MANNWIQHVKTYASKNGVSYTNALKDPRCKACYERSTAIRAPSKAATAVSGGKMKKLKIPKSISRAVQDGISKLLHMLSKPKYGKKSVLGHMTGMYSDDDMQISDRAPPGFDWRTVITGDVDEARMRELDRMYGTPMEGAGNRPSRRVAPNPPPKQQRHLPFPLPIDAWISLTPHEKFDTLDSYSSGSLRHLTHAIRAFLDVTGLTSEEALQFNMYRQVGADYIRVANDVIKSRDQVGQEVDVFDTRQPARFVQQMEFDDDEDEMARSSAMFRSEAIEEDDETEGAGLRRVARKMHGRGKFAASLPKKKT